MGRQLRRCAHGVGLAVDAAFVVCAAAASLWSAAAGGAEGGAPHLAAAAALLALAVARAVASSLLWAWRRPEQRVLPLGEEGPKPGGAGRFDAVAPTAPPERRDAADVFVDVEFLGAGPVGPVGASARQREDGAAAAERDDGLELTLRAALAREARLRGAARLRTARLLRLAARATRLRAALLRARAEVAAGPPAAAPRGAGLEEGEEDGGEATKATFGIARADFDGSQHGPDYLSLTAGDQIAILSWQPRGPTDRSWSYGLVNGRGPGWFPTAYFESARCGAKEEDAHSSSTLTEQAELSEIGLTPLSPAQPAAAVRFPGRRFSGAPDDFEELECRFSGEAFSIAFAARWDEVASSRFLVDLRARGASEGLAIYSLGGRGALEFAITARGERHFVTALGAVTEGEEHRYLCTAGAEGCLRIYRDGTLLAENRYARAPSGGSWTRLSLARSPEAGVESFAGTIANLRLWGAALTWDALSHEVFAQSPAAWGRRPPRLGCESRGVQTGDEAPRAEAGAQTEVPRAEAGAQTEAPAPAEAQAPQPGDAAPPEASPSSGGAAAAAAAVAVAAPGPAQGLQAKIVEKLGSLAEEKRALEARLAARDADLSAARAAADEARGDARREASRQAAELERLRVAASDLDRRAADAEARFGAARVLGAAQGAFHDAGEATLSIAWAEEAASTVAPELRRMIRDRRGKLAIGPPPPNWQTWLQLGLRHGAAAEPAMLRMQLHGSGADTHLGLLWPAPA